jgi:hypothetical protein
MDAHSKGANTRVSRNEDALRILLPSEFYLSVSENVPKDFIQSQNSWSMNISP